MKNRWDRYASHIGLDPHFQGAMWQLLIGLYHLPHSRAYHTIGWHIKHMLEDFWRFQQKHPDWTDKWSELEWAIWFHDIYHSPVDSANEVLSAQLAEILSQQHTRLSSNKVFWNVIATTHCMSGDYQVSIDQLEKEQRFMCDLDLAGFIAPEDIFLESQQRIRKEYSDVSDEDYKKGRKEFMRRLLDRGYVFLTDEFKVHENLAVNRIEGIIDGRYDK